MVLTFTIHNAKNPAPTMNSFAKHPINQLKEVHFDSVMLSGENLQDLATQTGLEKFSIGNVVTPGYGAPVSVDDLKNFYQSCPKLKVLKLDGMFGTFNTLNDDGYLAIVHSLPDLESLSVNAIFGFKPKILTKLSAAKNLSDLTIKLKGEGLNKSLEKFLKNHPNMTRIQLNSDRQINKKTQDQIAKMKTLTFIHK